MTLQGIKQRFGIIGRSQALENALSTAIRVANTDLTVLITGESGVGKEVFSKIIHGISKRKHNTFIAVNCGAIPEGTINSELFGHVKGSFTGATADRKGYFETANSGTIFLDEIGEMPLDTQAFLLRVLESGEFLRVGSSQVMKTDVRVIAATNIDLKERIRKGKFREDLYYRLSTVPIFVPALKDRQEDIYMLFRKFSVDFAEKYRTTPIQLDELARTLLERYSWPGNIRELKNLAEQLSVLSEEKLIDAETLLDIAPQMRPNNNLPSIRPQDDASTSFEEREILYKLLFDMKGDLNDLKSLVFELISKNDLEVGSSETLESLAPIPDYVPKRHLPAKPIEEYGTPVFMGGTPSDAESSTIVLTGRDDDYHDAEEVVDNLSLADMEKSMIRKALDKYKGRRKDAANELGISERTLYRKIKQYGL